MRIVQTKNKHNMTLFISDTTILHSFIYKAAVVFNMQVLLELNVTYFFLFHLTLNKADITLL